MYCSITVPHALFDLGIEKSYSGKLCVSTHLCTTTSVNYFLRFLQITVYSNVICSFYNFLKLLLIMAFKSAITQIEKALINDCFRVSKASWKFRIPTIYNFAVICQWNLQFSYEVVDFLTVSIVFYVYKQNFKDNNFKTRKLWMRKVVFNCVEAIVYLLLYNFHDL